MAPDPLLMRMMPDIMSAGEGREAYRAG